MEVVEEVVVVEKAVEYGRGEEGFGCGAMAGKTDAAAAMEDERGRARRVVVVVVVAELA